MIRSICVFILHAFVVKDILTCIYLLFILSRESVFHLYSMPYDGEVVIDDTCIYLLFILSRESVFHRVAHQRQALYRTFYLLHISSYSEREGSRRKG